MRTSTAFGPVFAILLTSVLAQPVQAEETITFQVPVDIKNFDPTLTVEFQVTCRLGYGDYSQYVVSEMKSTSQTFTGGAFKGTITVPVARRPQNPKPKEWGCRAEPVKAVGADQVTHWCIDWGMKSWPCKLECGTHDKPLCTQDVKGFFE